MVLVICNIHNTNTNNNTYINTNNNTYTNNTNNNNINNNTITFSINK